MRRYYVAISDVDWVVRQLNRQQNKKGMERVKDGWSLTAHGVIQYADGTIEWNYSTGEHFPY